MEKRLEKDLKGESDNSSNHFGHGSHDEKFNGGDLITTEVHSPELIMK